MKNAPVTILPLILSIGINLFVVAASLERRHALSRESERLNFNEKITDI